jgi:hypothetical protein
VPARRSAGLLLGVARQIHDEQGLEPLDAIGERDERGLVDQAAVPKLSAPLFHGAEQAWVGAARVDRHRERPAVVHTRRGARDVAGDDHERLRAGLEVAHG